MNGRFKLVFLPVLILVVLFLMGSEVNRYQNGCAGFAPFESGSPRGALSRIPEAWLPGGIRVTGEAAIPFLGPPSPSPVSAATVESESLGMDLIFPQVADGQSSSGNIRLETSFILVNTSWRQSDATIRFFKEDGTPLTTRVDGVEGTEFSYSLGWNQVLRVKTDGTGPLQVGWAKVHVTQPLAITAVFSVSDIKGKLDAEVGVGEAAQETDFALFVEADGDTSTGLAFCNVDEDSSNRVTLILNSMDGQEVGRTEITLEALGKRARFINELFRTETAAGFEGVLILRAEHPIGVIALRQKGKHLTSMPSVGRYEAGVSMPDLYFYRIGAGELGELLFQTSFILVNNSEHLATVQLDLYQEDGMALVTTLADLTDSVHEIEVPSYGAVRVKTSETGPIKLGWGKIQSDQALGALAAFTQYRTVANAQGFGSSPVFVSEVGVEATFPLKKFSIFGDSISNRGTAIALCNTDTEQDAEVRISFFDTQNNWVAVSEITLPPLGHTAKFMGELFPDIEGIDEIEGRLYVYSGNIGIAGGTLRLAGNLLTSLPVMYQLYGFKPSAEIDFNTMLGGTSPAVAFKIQQFGEDMSLDNVEVTIPGVQFDPGLFESAEEGSVVMVADSGDTRASAVSALGYLDSIAEDGTTVIGLHQIATDGLFEIGRLTLSETEEGVRAFLQLLNRKPNTYADESLFLQLLFPSAVFQLPEGKTSFQSETRFVSVSTSRRSDQRLIEINRQDFETVTLPESTPKILRVTPYQRRSDGPVRIDAANLSSTGNLEVLFSTWDDEPIASELLIREDQQILAQVPEGIVSGDVVIRSNGLESNPYYFRLLFGPVIDFSFESLAAGSSPAVNWSFGQEKGELGLLNWSINLSGVSLETSGLESDQKVGTITLTSHRWSWVDECDLTVETISEDDLVLVDANNRYRFKISKDDSGDIVIENVIEYEPSTPAFHPEGITYSWMISAPIISLPQSGQVVLDIEATSWRFSVNSNSKYKTYDSEVFTVE